MKFNEIMHVSFYTNQIENMIDFYTNKLGCNLKIVTRAKSYKGRTDRPANAALAETDPERLLIVYVEIAPNQFVEMFPATKEGKILPAAGQEGFAHFALLVDDINATYKDMQESGVPIDTDISKGPSETWQFWIHDPDGNKFEIMQFTDKSYQVVGHIDD